MDTIYKPQKIEKYWSRFWEDQGYFAPKNTGKAYTIMIPPPNVTGNLHMGHAFQQSIMDALIRYQRMKGLRTLWQTGTDHAGIATQMVVERKLASENITRQNLSREEFIQKIIQWKQQSGTEINDQMRNLGNSVDWSSERFTLDPGFCEAVQHAFIKLYEDGYAYRAKRLVNWDSHLLTAISDLEVENREKEGFLWHIRYSIGNQKNLIIATTRPETLLGDVALSVHPQDNRYNKLIGQQAIIPLINRTIPIIGDEQVNPEFGSGCVKVTPAHDFNDYEIAQRHQLSMINIMTTSAHIADKAKIYNYRGLATNSEFSLPKQLVGLERFVARKTIIKILKEQGFIEKIQPHTLQIPYGDRSGTIIEPLLTDQWFIRTNQLAKPSIEAVETNKIQFVPDNYRNMYFAWMNNLQDWCISRQLWWGHRIPAWYDENHNIYVGTNEEQIRKKYQLADQLKINQDEDVFDTWFSSSLWTFATLGWPKKTERLQIFYPTDVLVTGFDIIFFWVARMIMMSLYLVKQIPFHKVYIHGLILDEKGKKMSKSKGNVLDPLDMINGITYEKLINKRTGNLLKPEQKQKIINSTRKQFPQGIAPHGADALRYTLYSLASTGRNLNWDMKRLEGYRNFCNKIWNASRYILMNLDQYPTANHSKINLGICERWIISRLQQVNKKVQHTLDNFRFDHTAKALYEFIWTDFCDWYLEISKIILNDPKTTQEQLLSTQHTLMTVLEQTLRLAHPLIPFITEEIWQKIKKYDTLLQNKPSIMMQDFPKIAPKLIDLPAEQAINWLQNMVSAVRDMRRELNLSPSKKITVWLQITNKSDNLINLQNLFTQLTKIENLTICKKEPTVPYIAKIVDNLKIMLPVDKLVDYAQKKQQIMLKIDKLANEIQQLNTKLSGSFAQRAPANIVADAHNRLKKAQNAQQQLIEQLNKFAN